MKVAVLQCAFREERESNIEKVEALCERAAAAGANIILPSELFESRYFPQLEDESYFELARPFEGHPTIARFSKFAAAHNIVIPVSYFERAGQAYYNSVAIIDADGKVLGNYRKSHIPDGPGYEEKYYFRPGDTGFRVWKTKHATIGVGICWDQWFPECARAMTLLGAELLLYPTAIGSEPAEPDNDTAAPWRRAMLGHAVCNAIAVAAANRIGQEDEQTFYGTSFISDHRGEILGELGREEEGFASAELDLEAIRRYRDAWGFFRDRRPEQYGILTE